MTRVTQVGPVGPCLYVWQKCAVGWLQLCKTHFLSTTLIHLHTRSAALGLWAAQYVACNCMHLSSPAHVLCLVTRI